MAGRFSIEAVFKAVDRVTRPITRMGSKFKKNMRLMGASVDRVSRKVRALGKTVRSSLGVVGAAGVFLVLSAAIGSVITKGAEFEQALVGASARFGSGIDRNSEQFAEMSALAQDLGKTTEFTATEAAGGLNFLAKAGFDATLSMKLLPGIVDLATASELDLARASDIATDAMGAFGKNMGTTSERQANFIQLSDQMAKTIRISNVNMEQLFETVKKGAPAATAAGTSMETFLGLTAQFAGAGLKASDAGTALKNIFVKLADSKVQRSMKTMGVAVKDSLTGGFRDFADIMDDLNAAFDKNDVGAADRLAAINDMFGLRGLTGVANVLQNGTAGFRKYRASITDSIGETERLAKVLRATRQGRIKEMSSAFEGLTLSVSAFSDKGINGVIGGLTSLTRTVDRFVNNNEGLLISMTILGGVALAIGGVNLAAMGLMFTLGAIPAILSFIAGSMSAIAFVIVGLSLALAKFASEFQFVQDFFNKQEEWSSFSRSIGNFIMGDDEAEGFEQRQRNSGPDPVPSDRQGGGSNSQSTTTQHSTLEISGAPEGSVLTTPNANRYGIPGITMASSGSFS